MKLGLEVLDSKPKYDSTEDTKAHIALVNKHMATLVESMQNQVVLHDASKLESPEKEAFDEATPLLKGLTYGSKEYRDSLRKIKPALDHHYSVNTHHPEHFKNGMFGMTLVDLLEQFTDWAAATERHEDGCIIKSIVHNAERYGYTGMLENIFLNTATKFKMGKGYDTVLPVVEKDKFMTVESIAKIVYEANRAYCSSQNDNSFKPWEEAEQWQKDTILKGIEFHRCNPSAGPSASHNSWLKEKQDTGWKYGEVKDAEKKEHPCMVPYEKLPEFQKAKDSLFINIVRTFMPFLKTEQGN